MDKFRLEVLNFTCHTFMSHVFSPKFRNIFKPIGENLYRFSGCHRISHILINNFGAVISREIL